MSDYSGYSLGGIELCLADDSDVDYSDFNIDVSYLDPICRSCWAYKKPRFRGMKDINARCDEDRFYYIYKRCDCELYSPENPRKI